MGKTSISKRMQYLFIFSLIFLFYSALFAGFTGKISGDIKDTETGQPLPGANVLIVGTQMGAAADMDGHYYILNVPPGVYNIKVTMMGYTGVEIQGVVVTSDHTTPQDFALSMTAVEGELVTIVAEREVIKMDNSSSQRTATADDVTAVPIIQDIDEFINLQAGVEDEVIRGGGLDQTALVVDGLVSVDNVNNEPLNLVNLSAIEEVSIVTGGFNAEYGNIRSGLISIVTKAGGQRYHGSADFRYTPAGRRHRSASLYSMNNFLLRPYLDPAVCWVGTKWGDWDAYTQQQNLEFEGWNQFVENNPELGLTAEEARNLFIWQHAAEGSKELGHPHPGKYGDKSDYNLDMSFGGPVPLIGKYLGDLTFFTSFRKDIERPVLPAARNYILKQNWMVKLNANISPSMRFGLEGMFGREEIPDEGGGSNVEVGEVGRGAYFPHAGSPMDIDQSVIGLTFDHVLNPSTFYNVRFTRVAVENDQYGARTIRDTTPLATFGDVTVDEQPWGFHSEGGYQYALADQMVLGGVGAAARNFNKIATYNLKFDITSQINKYNQIKAGFEFNYDDYDIWYGDRDLDVTGNFTVDWEKQPIRGGAYIQNKLEFQGMIANLGVRFDYNDPNTDWYTVDRYSKYFSRAYEDLLVTESPQEPAEGHLKISPRIGISHPITDKSKLYFNYGHFYSMPTSEQMYTIDYGVASEGIAFLGNPNLKMPRTIAYELGYEHELGDMYLLRVAGYYKDVTDQAGDVYYINYDESVNYAIQENNHYADIRGFELELRKSWGRWVTGWINYNYRVETNGFIGREVYYQDPRRMAVEGYRDPIQEKPLPQPFARANIQFRTPFEFGPEFLGFYPFESLSLSMLAHYRAGDYLTWEPLPPYKVENNLQWKDVWDFDMRFQKEIHLGQFELTVFADIINVFDIKRLAGDSEIGFYNEADFRDYMNSLHLPMYGKEKYQNNPTYTKGNDRVGDVRSKDKPYINMPNVNFASWNPPRTVIIGAIIEF